MTSERISLNPTAEGTPPGLGTRLLSLTFLVGSAAAVIGLAVSVTQLFLDPWIAPANLSPDNDRVLQLHLSVARSSAELARAEVEVARVVEQVAAIDTAIERLGRLRDNSAQMFAWGADEQARVAGVAADSLRHLEAERRLLTRMVARQHEVVERARANLEGGLLGRHDLEREEAALDRLVLQETQNARSRAEAERAGRQARAEHAALAGEGDAPHAPGRLPSVVQREEQMTRLELEIVELEAERRGLLSLRRVAADNVREVRSVLDQLRERPLWQATERSLDVAFVPYEQLDGVHPGDRLVHCEWLIAGCRAVGRVDRVLAGEVVTQDPWGDLARGRFAVLDLTEPEAVRERILRVQAAGR